MQDNQNLGKDTNRKLIEEKIKGTMDIKDVLSEKRKLI